MNEEKIQILKMIENGTITAEEGMKLLDAVTGDTDSEKKKTKSTLKWARIIVTSPRKEQNANIKIPVELFKVGAKISAKFSKELESSFQEIDFNAILEAISAGAEGEVLNVVTDEGYNIKIIVE